MTQAYEKLRQLLEELFQFDREDLDFGIYRIMNQKRAEVSRFLDHDLLPQVQQAFAEYRAGDDEAAREELATLEMTLRNAGDSAESSPKYVALKNTGNFYPHFILWLLVGDRQYVTFVDPKGIRNLQGENDPRFEFHSTIKEIEDRLGDPNVILNSFIISNTPYSEVIPWKLTKEELEDRHVLFQSEDKTTYIRAMFNRILSETVATESAIE